MSNRKEEPIKKVKNVIRGYMSWENIEKLTIIAPESEKIAIFSGSIETYLNPDDGIRDYKNYIDNLEVVKSTVDCGQHLFLIVKEETDYEAYNNR